MTKTKRLNSYEKHLANLHAKINTPDEVINNAVREAVGVFPALKIKILKGEANEVYEVKTSKGDFFVRISRSEKPDYLQEKWAIEQVSEIGVPVPESLLIKHVTLDGQQLSINIQKKIRGDTLERGDIDYKSMDQEKLKKIIVKAGELLSRIHSVKTVGFKHLDGNGVGSVSTYREMWNDLLVPEKEKECIEIAKTVKFSPVLMKKIFELLRDEISKAPNISPVLNHGDYGPKHIMVEDETITGILDWGGVSGNSPIADFAWWDYWYGDSIPISWLQEGYADKSMFDSNFERWLTVIKLKIGAGMLYWFSIQNYKEGVEKAKEHLIKDFEYFKKIK